MATPSHQTSVHGCRDEAQRLLGPGHVFQKRCLRLPDLGVPKTNRYAKSGQVIPDVFIQEHPRPGERRHEVVYDPERWHRQEGEPRLWGLRLSGDGEYEDIEPIRHENGQPVYRSDMLGEFRLLDEGEDLHTLQTWDEEQGIWMDPKQATVLETGARNILSLLSQQAAQGALAPDVPDTLATAWQKAQWVPDFAEALRVTSSESDQSTLLPPGDRRT